MRGTEGRHRPSGAIIIYERGLIGMPGVHMMARGALSVVRRTLELPGMAPVGPQGSKLWECQIADFPVGVCWKDGSWMMPTGPKSCSTTSPNV